MTLSDAGEARVRGYLFMFESSLRTFLPRDAATDACREVESHIRERVRDADGMPNERDALERLLRQLGTPHRLAQAYSTELVVEEAVSTGRLSATARAVYALAVNTVQGFVVGLGLFIGYMLGLSMLLVAVLKPIFPNNVGVILVDGQFRGVGAQFWLPPNAEAQFGWVVAGVGAVGGALLVVLTHRAARAYLEHVRERRRQRLEAAGV
jgi:uncharacterized membrane protein